MNEKGFTLIESLLVLTILGIITTITLQIVLKTSEDEALDAFLNQLQLDVLTAQSYSIEKKQLVNIVFIVEKNIYKIKDHDGKTIYIREGPENLIFSPNSNLKRISFVSGKLRSFGTVNIRYGERRIELIVYIERGRTKVVEQ